MSNCNQATITDAAFAHLRGIHVLYMHGCDQATITDAAFAHLRVNSQSNTLMVDAKL
jgi:hypothetical protein